MLDSLLHQFLNRDAAGPLVQFIKYVLAGGIATAVDMGVFYLVAWKLIPALREDDPIVTRLKIKVTPVTEKQRSARFVYITVIAFMFSNMTAYLINVFWVFTPDPDKAMWLEILQFYAVSGISVFLGAGMGWAMIKWLHFSTTTSYVSKMVASLLINFVCRKFFIFKA